MKYKVRFIDYPKQFNSIRTQVMSKVEETLSKGDLILREQTEEFENGLAEFIGVKHAIGVSSGTDALHLSLRAAGIGNGDEVITVSHTFVATAAAIHHTGATPALVDIQDDHNMNPDLLKDLINERTKAIAPVHLNGRMCDMNRISKVADEHGLMIIEDAAQALGASLDSRGAGSWGLTGCFSFYPAKLLGSFGEAGAVVTNNDEIARLIRLYRNHGRTEDKDIAFWSFNCRIHNLQAALLGIKLRTLPDSLLKRRHIAEIYHEGLSQISDLKLPIPPKQGDAYWDVYQNYEIEARSRDELMNHLTVNGVEVMLPWGGKGVHQFSNLELSHYHLPKTEDLMIKALLLPMHDQLEDDQARFVCSLVRDFYY